MRSVNCITGSDLIEMSHLGLIRITHFDLLRVKHDHYQLTNDGTIRYYDLNSYPEAALIEHTITKYGYTLKPYVTYYLRSREMLFSDHYAGITDQCKTPHVGNFELAVKVKEETKVYRHTPMGKLYIVPLDQSRFLCL